MIYYEEGSINTALEENEIKNAIKSSLSKYGENNKTLIIPPDFTRYHSRAGELTQYAWGYLKNKVKAILPALGTHYPMTVAEMDKMFGPVPQELFVEHNFRKDVVSVGTVPGEYVKEVSGGSVEYDMPAQVNRLLIEGDFDLILSIGQVVPHEVIGMANYNKNIFVGTGGAEGIDKSHFLGAAYGMEKIMGRADSPVRRVLEYASQNFTNDLPILYILNVIGKDEDGNSVMRGLYIGDDYECFEKASALSLKVNFNLFDTPVKKIVAYLNPDEYKSTWLGNKAIYRTRMLLADDGELIIIAPGIKEFGEDKDIDKLIRKYGYPGTPKTLQLVKDNKDLRNNLSAAAHMIHGSSEDRFKITYCPGGLTKEEIENANFNYGNIDEYKEKYNFNNLKDGWNNGKNEEIYYISNPATGLWAAKSRFE